MKNWLKATLLTLVLSFSVMGWGQSVNFFTDRAVGTYPIPGQTGVTALVPVQYGQVRVCNFSASPGIPCASLATITDINGNPLSVSGGNFGQLSTDVVGRFSFGCTPGTVLTIQVAAVSSNTPLLNYPTTCPFASSGSTIDAIFNSITAGAGTFTGNVSVGGTLNSQTVNGLYNAGKYATISAALTAAIAAGSPGVWIPCGTYSDNITITSSVTILGEDKACVIINPATVGNPVISINGTTVNSIDRVTIRQLTIQCPPATACGDGILITGKQASNEVTDHLVLEDILIGTLYTINTAGTAGFTNGIDVTGRTIWSTINRVQSKGNKGDGLHVALTGGVVGPVNALSINDSEFSNNFNYGINWNSAGAVTGTQGTIFKNVTVEFNGNNSALSPCAGAIFQGIWSTTYSDGLFEENCAGAADPNRAHLRLTGAVTRNFNIFGGTFTNDTGTSAKYGIFADGNVVNGTWTGMDFIGTWTKTIHVAIPYTGELRQPLIIGSGFGLSAPEFVADSFGNSAAFSQYPWAPMIYQVGNAAFPITANVIDLTDGATAQPGNVLALVSGPNTINKITGATVGQILWIFTASGSANTVANAAGGAGQITLRDGANRTLAAGDWLMLYSQDGSTWKEVPLGASLPGLANTWSQTQTFKNGLVAGGTAAGLTGTGACATITTQTGGSWAGRATCTGTTGASTLTITPGQTAPNGWVCNVQDQTTRANVLQQTSTTTTACTLTATSVTQNDVIVFSAIAF